MCCVTCWIRFLATVVTSRVTGAFEEVEGRREGTWSLFSAIGPDSD